MRKRLLTSCFVICALCLSVSAQLASQVAGTYTGKLTVVLGGNEEEAIVTDGTKVILNETGTDIAKLSLMDFAFMEEKIGDIVVPDLSLTSSDKAIKFVKDPVVITFENTTEFGGTIAMLVAQQQSSLSGNIANSTINLSIYIPEIVGGIDVKFVGTLTTTNIGDHNVSSAIFYNLHTGKLNMPAGEQYQVYNIAGQLVKSGRAASNAVSLDDLRNGLYLVKVGKVTTKIVKK